ncbi:MAG: protein translocase subunit SecF [Chloroflexia bacterium]|jgi:preprotein translocase subunit SecF|nr:protein translocase subunit SecF [Chloroflexia bacterium]
MLDLVGKRNLWFIISAILLVPGIISLAVEGLNLGIDFTGGTAWEIQMSQPVTTTEVREVLSANGFGDAVVQTSDDNTVIIRMSEIREGAAEKIAITEDLQTRFGEFEELSFTTVGPSVGTQIRNRSIYAVGLASIGVLLYIAWAFRNTNNPLLYGICAIVAMLHDVLLVLGIFSILGWTLGVEVDALFVTAILTIIGFSVHDTIVVFDRIRENLANKMAPTFDETVNYSVVQTIVRSINTSLTVVLTLAALYLFGGESTRWFVMALLIGVVAGTYSSIFNAAQLLVAWEQGDIRRFFTFGRGGNEPQRESRTIRPS